MKMDSNFSIEVVNRQQVFDCQAGQLLLAAMEKKNRDGIRVGCRGGACGICKVKILSGVYQCKPMSRSQVSTLEQQQGFALACRVLPESDLCLEADHFQAPKAAAKQITAAQVAAQLNKNR